MKRILATIALMMTIVVSATAMSFSQARSEAHYLSDKMAYELDLSPEQYAAVYEINLDYLLSVTSQYDVYGAAWARRNSDLRFVLNYYQYEMYIRTSYFYEPLEWTGTTWRYGIYTRYTDRSRFFFSYPTSYSSYRGGNNRVADYYSNRHYNKPTGKPRSWRDNATGNVRNNWRQNSTGGVPQNSHSYGTHNHGNYRPHGDNGSHGGSGSQYNNNRDNRNSHSSGGSSWRRNASGADNSNGQTGTTGTRSTKSSDKSGGGQFGGKR